MPGRGGGERAGASRSPRPHRRRTAPRLQFVLLVLLWGLILGGGALFYFAFTLPDTSRLAAAERRPSITILAADGSPIATYGDLFGRALSLKEMSPYLPEAVIATEDRRFYSNFGIDPIGIARAALADLMAGHIVEGGSTITQQLAKNLFLTPRRTLGRKIREVLLALWLDHRFTKNEILEIYLSRIYLGAGAYGVDAAARRYFHKSARRLSLYESAMLAGLLKAPTRYNPIRDRALAAQRTAQVLDNMVDAGFITRGQANAAARQGEGSPGAVAGRPGSRYFADWIADQLHDFVGGNRSDLTVTTTLDPRLQSEAEAAVDGILARDGAAARIGEGALVAMTPDGAVRALVGGRDYDESQFDRATEALRQPGSAFKPFVYLAGLEAGLSPADHFIDRPIRIGNWQPHDYTGHYLGDVTMAEGLAQSINTVAVQIAERAGVNNVIAVAHRLGIASRLPPDASIALGTGEVNLLELTSAYATFANGGHGVLPYGILVIRDRQGRVLFRREGSGLGRVMSPQDVGAMNEMLRRVVSEGTGRKAALPRPAAGKTGTTQDYRDAWFLGYTADLVAGVWFGNDNDSPMRGVTGGSLPAEAWRDFMLAATRGAPLRPLPGAGSPTVLAAAPAGAAPAGGSLLGNFIRLLEGQAPPPSPGDYGQNDRGGGE
ncbi:MAG TPA: PBP1A family penicillin-binding protein [Stellaceae bacterium]|nr:PBP1A family penicillin-binding protein [Stellaceae bacterium]